MGEKERGLERQRKGGGNTGKKGERTQKEEKTRKIRAFRGGCLVPEKGKGQRVGTGTPPGAGKEGLRRGTKKGKAATGTILFRP